ncbi:hypothetical protein [Pararhodonellum marinum]|uniref:hypothetical protein n=1 Tax=Pararhodonellum marinum TaxID=2755358 RepID=UPI00188EE555|nr:hypothetical protein [Pararhodonellum marinum]
MTGNNPTWLNRLVYALMILVSLINYFWLKETSQAFVTFMLALAFDPFDPSVKWQDRPLWQKVWLIGHLLIGVIILMMLILNKN